jgi:hypothetical protein
MTATMIRGSLTCPPRFGTPRSDRPTLGDKAGVIAARLRRPFMPWQRHVADVALELDPDGSLHYDEVNLLVGRQEGKTELKFVLMVMRMTVMAARLGPQRVTYTMQSRKKARTRLERDYAARLRRAAGFREIQAVSRLRPTKQTEWRLGMNSGVEAIQFGPESYIQIDTPNRTDGHGDSIDAGFIDEAFAHEDNTVELGMEPAMVTRSSAQLWVLSASGDAKSKYLWAKVLRGRKLAGEDGTVAYFEWSAEYGEDDPGDPETWRKACPALGFKFPAGGGISEAKLRSLYAKALEDGRKESLDGFCRSYLCMWPEVPVLTDEVLTWRVIPRDLWEDRQLSTHKPEGRVQYALDVDMNGRGEQWASIGASDGTHIEDVTPPTATPGTGWVVAACVAKKDLIDELAVATDGPAFSLVDDLEKAGVTVRRVKPGEFTQASMQLLEALPDLWHIGQPKLTTAAAGVVRRNVGDGQWRFSRTLSPVDVGPLNAIALARWLAGQDSASIYEERGMVSL